LDIVSLASESVLICHVACLSVIKLLGEAPGGRAISGDSVLEIIGSSERTSSEHVLSYETGWGLLVVGVDLS